MMHSTSGPDPGDVIAAFRAHRSHVCAGCGGVLRHLQTRHSVDGAVFHTECVPGRPSDEGAEPRPTAA
jgi:hypothetical protein